jgi:septin family protein
MTEFGDAMNEFPDLEEALGRLCLMIAGVTGTGKTTLMNALFGHELHEIPPDPLLRESTNSCRESRMPNCPVTILDTVGFEQLPGRNEEASFDWLDSEIDRRARSEEETHVHFVIYCVAESSNRFEPLKITFCRRVVEELKIPVLIAITMKTTPPDDHGLQEAIRAQLAEARLASVHVVEVLAVREEDLLEEVRRTRPEKRRECIDGLQEIGHQAPLESGGIIPPATADVKAEPKGK